MTRRRVPVWALVSAAWVGPALLAALKEYLQGQLPGADPVPFKVMLFEFGDWLLLSLLTPLIFRFARRYPMTREKLSRRIPLHMVASIGLCLLWSGLGNVWSLALFGDTAWGGPLGWFLTTLPFGVSVYFAMVGVEHAMFYFFESQQREVQAARLQAQLADARLGALRMQLQPHFLFNSLNAIAVVVRDRDTTTASRMLEQLGEMLRRVMRKDRPQEVTLEEELDFVRKYLAIEEVRFSDRLRPVFEIAAEVTGAAVPEFILQPLVENALRHGLAQRVSATLLRIEARREAGDLVLAVTDDGPGPGATLEPGEGVGLANTRERLATLYGERARLTLERTGEGGARAAVRLPYRRMEAAGG